MSILAQDTFQRIDMNSSWGIASDGNPWTIVAQPAGTVQVSGGIGQVSNSNTNGTNFLIGSASRTDAEALVQFSLSNVNAACHPILRYQSAGNFYYAGQDVSGNLAIKVRVNDVGTQLAASANVLTANQKYWVRFRVQGTTLSLRFWQDGNAEPGTWNLQITDTTYAAGAVGQRNTCASTTDTISIYSYTVTDLTSTSNSLLVADTFARGNQSNWGNASDGELWVAKDANATYSIVSNRGQATGFSASSNSVLGGTAEYDTDMTVRFSTSVPASDGVFLIARWTGLPNFYYVGFVQNTLSIRKTVSSTQTTLASTTFTAIASTNYWLRCSIQGPNIKLRCWQDGTTEPTTWNLSVPDGALLQGNPGLRLFGGASDIVSVDNFAVKGNGTMGILPTGMAGPGYGKRIDDLLNTLGVLGNPDITESDILNWQRQGLAYVVTTGLLATATNANLTVGGLCIFNPVASGKVIIIYEVRVVCTNSSIYRFYAQVADAAFGNPLTPVNALPSSGNTSIASCSSSANGVSASVTPAGTVKGVSSYGAVTPEDVPLNNGAVEILTPGKGISYYPFVTTAANQFAVTARYAEF